MTSATCGTSSWRRTDAGRGRLTEGRRHGFTLVELLMAITLMGLVVGLAVPRIGAVRSTYFAAESAKSVANALRSARIGAIRDRTTVALVPVPGDASALEDRRLAARSWSESDAAWLTGRWLQDDVIWDGAPVRVIHLNGQVEIDAPGQGILFYADGSSTGGDIVVRDEDYQVQHHFRVDALTGEIFVQ
jgi:prepilin-type N-terminal cleavage/methylation domain-containing protein